MQKIKKFLEAVVVITVVMAFVSPSLAVFTNEGTSSVIVQDHIKSYKKILPKDVLSQGENILMPSGEGDDILPSITMDNSGHTVVTWTNEADVTTANMGIAYSSDPTDPMSWIGWIISLTETTYVWYSDTAMINGPNPEDYHGLYGGNLYYDTTQVGGYQIPDVTSDPSEWMFYYWSYVVDGQVCRAVEDGGYYDEPNYDHVGPVSMVIWHWNDQGYDVPACPIYMNQDVIEGGSTTFYFDAQSHLYTAPANDCDYATFPNIFHVTWQYHNQSTDKDMIVWKKIDPAVEPDIEYTPYQEYLVEGTNPSIEGYQDGGSNHLAIVYTNEDSMNCIYSSDDGATWSAPVNIDFGTYPALRAIGKTLYCAYFYNGDVYLTTSNDGGKTWSSSEQVNDQDGTAVEKENYIDIHAGGIVWVDERNADKDIYWAPFEIGSPPGAPTINGPTSGKQETSYDYVFTAVDPDGDQVKYVINWGDGNSDTTTLNPSGTGVTVSHSWAEQKTYKITAKAVDSTGLTGPEGSFDVNIPRTRTINIRFFDLFPNAFPFLRILLGL